MQIRNILLPVSAIIASCAAIAAAHYHIPKARVMAAIESTGGSAKAGRVGIAGIPVAWLPYLKQYGFSPEAVVSNACENVVAGAWILAYTDRIQASEHGERLPARAQRWQPTVHWIARRAGVSPSLVNAVIEQESGFRVDAEGPRTRRGERAIGLMQLLPSTAHALGVNPYQPAQNIWGGTFYLANLLRAYGGDVALALAAYNAGPAAVSRYGGIPPYGETEKYVPTVLARARAFAQTDPSP